mgnify:CR=1 FL=1|tara:strand:- start:2242 stop:2844 length:603 start_codon:yes stop_codon:yes gene_type:complete
MKKIIYTNADNSVVVITPAPKARLTKQVQIGEKKALGIDGESLQILKKDNSGKLVEDENGEFLYVDLMIPVYETQFAETENKFIERIAKKDVPTGLKYKIIDETELPTSRSWRNAWTYNIESSTFDIDLEKAKVSQKEIIIAKAHERVAKNSFGTQNFDAVIEEIEAIDFDQIKTKDELYNTFPLSINNRDGNRVYKIHK